MALQSTTALATVTLQAASSTVTFSGIPNTYRDLILVCQARSTRNASDDDLFLKFNGSSTGYSYVRMVGRSTPNSAANINGTTQNDLGQIIAAGGTSGTFTLVTFSVFGYSSTDKHKTTLTRTNGVSTEDRVGAVAGRWASVDAVNSIQLYPATGSFLANSSFALFGRIA